MDPRRRRRGDLADRARDGAGDLQDHRQAHPFAPVRQAEPELGVGWHLCPRFDLFRLMVRGGATPPVLRLSKDEPWPPAAVAAAQKSGLSAFGTSESLLL